MQDNIFSLSEIQVRYKPKIPMSKRVRITSSEQAYGQFLLLLDRTQFNIREEAAILYLNRSNHVIGGYKLSAGGITGTIVDIRIILGVALRTLSCGMIIAHTHPSGELSPSGADKEFTKKLSQATRLMDINLLDHIIISGGRYFSFMDGGIM
jgi:DNA repair protein RadC